MAPAPAEPQPPWPRDPRAQPLGVARGLVLGTPDSGGDERGKGSGCFRHHGAQQWVSQGGGVVLRAEWSQPPGDRSQTAGRCSIKVLCGARCKVEGRGHCLECWG